MKTRSIILSAFLLLIGNTAVAEGSKENFRVHPFVSDPEFLQPGQWWNLVCSKRNDPLKRSIRAVKILHVSKGHPGWVQIAFPESRDEHFSIFGPAAKAHDDDSIKKEEAIAKWEKSVSKWKVIWINLDYVVSASQVAENPSAEEEVYKVKEESGPTAAPDDQ